MARKSRDLSIRQKIGLDSCDSLLKCRTYRIWKGFRARCVRKSHHAFNRYGGRGISYDLRWNSFESFFDDMGHPPTPKHTLDRKDNDGPYSKSNCKWSTKSEQMNNTRINRVVHLDGKRLTLRQACRIRNLRYTSVHKRLTVYGWSISKSLNTPIRNWKHSR